MLVEEDMAECGDCGEREREREREREELQVEG
jgi:hypothetical protein